MLFRIYLQKIVLLIISIQLNFAEICDCLACYSCLALNYRQNVLSRYDDLLPPQTKENLSDLFNSLTLNGVAHVEVASTCADVALTSQPSFLNAPIAICRQNDKCVKMDFNYKGEKIVLRNCLSNLMKNKNNAKFMHSCRVSYDEPTGISIGGLKNVSSCSCQSDLCNISSNNNIFLFYYFIIFFLYLQMFQGIISFS